MSSQSQSQFHQLQNTQFAVVSTLTTGPHCKCKTQIMWYTHTDFFRTMFKLRVRPKSKLASDSKLFCKNKQVHLKNYTKRGKLREKQNKMRLVRKFNKTNKQQVNWTQEEGGKFKKSTEWANLRKSTNKFRFALNGISKSAIKLAKKAIRKTEIWNNKPKNKQIFIESSPKTNNAHVLK